MKLEERKARVKKMKAELIDLERRARELQYLILDEEQVIALFERSDQA